MNIEQQLGVTVVNGERVKSEGKCKDVSIKLQCNEFTMEAYVLVLRGCDVVLGVQWLSTLGTISWNFSELTMQFSHMNREVMLKGLVPTQFMHEPVHFRMPKGEKRGLILQLMGEGSVDTNEFQEIGAVTQLLKKFSQVFEKPMGLPPKRTHDHAIILKDGAQPVSVRPYRYAYFQNDEIERTVKELLQTGVVRPSQSPFSSPVLLVRKADGSWRMCVNYCALNNVTVKDKFLIP